MLSRRRVPPRFFVFSPAVWIEEVFIAMQDTESSILNPGCLAGGSLRVTATPKGIRRIELFEAESRRLGRDPQGTGGAAGEILKQACAELGRYFSGEEVVFQTPIDLESSSTPFQMRVWKALFEIPRGEFRTYGELAVEAGSPRAARAVGQAVGKNPVPVIYPCHRVIAGNGSLGGFSCGVSLKVLLLELEGMTLKEPGHRPCPGSRWSELRMG